MGLVAEQSKERMLAQARALRRLMLMSERTTGGLLCRLMVGQRGRGSGSETITDSQRCA